MGEKIVNHPVWRRLTTWLQSEEMESPILLHGSDNDQMENWAEALQQMMVCQTGDNFPCGECRACEQARLKQHQDIIVVLPEEGLIRIKEMRAAKTRLHMSTWKRKRMVFIKDAENSRSDTANIMLKAFEEPAVSTRFLLTTIQWRKVLPTVRSRCQSIRLPVELTRTTELPEWLELKTLERVTFHKSKDPLSANDLRAIETFLEKLTRENGPTEAVKKSWSLLRDYYYVVSHGGNESMAKDLLIMSLPEIAQ
jgi:DNA polymerase III subunit delta'